MPSPFPMTKKMVYEGYTINLYSIGYLSYMCNRTRHCIRRWQKDKILPKPLFDIHDGRRWYTAAELIGYTKIVREGRIRTGIKIDHQVRERMGLFKIRLKKIFDESPGKVIRELPNEFSIKDLMKKHQEGYFKSEANKLVDEISDE